MQAPVRGVDVERVRQRSEVLKFVGVAVGVMLAAELISAVVRATVPPEARYWILKPVLSVHHQEYLSGLGGLRGLIVVAGIAVAVPAYRFLVGLPELGNVGSTFRVGAALWLGGGAANTAERFARGSVTDYLAIRLNGGGTVLDTADLAVYVGLPLVMAALATRWKRQKACAGGG